MLERRVRAEAAGAQKKTTLEGYKRPANARPRSIRPVTRAQPRVASYRPLVLLVIMVLCSAALVSRLAFWQVMQHGRLAAQTAAEHAAMAYQAPLRGRIYDDRGDPLATDITMNTVYAVPRDIKDPARTAAEVAPVLGLSVKSVQDAMTGDSLYVPLAYRVNQATSKKLQQLALSGVGLEPQIVRDYPDGSEAGQVLGYVNANNQGNYGLEGHYNSLLAGKAGLRSVLRDTAGNTVRISSAPSTAAHAGGDLHLTLDPMVQNLVENELHRAVQKHRADSGTVIVEDPRNGRILAMASTPGYDPNQYNTVTDYSRFINPAISDTYEPGSTFKIITMAAGLDTHVITPRSAFDDTGIFMVDGTALHNWNDLGNGWENMTQVLQHSANVGASWVANRLGISRFYTYIHRFRIGQPTHIGLSGEVPGQVWLPGQKEWNIVTLYTNSFGQGLTVTPLQLVQAVGAVANHGRMMKPQIVHSIVYDGHIIQKKPVSLGQVITPRTSYELTNMLVHSAIDGEASFALVKGYNIAAKTGTANVAGSNGQYLQGVTIASTIGYAPAFHPRFLVLAIIRHPRDQPWGSTVAAPILHDLFQELFMYYHIPPSPNAINR